MDNSKVSVIIPIYNVGTYLRDCLESVINQTYNNMEIICIDDGSTDDSGKICDEYAKKDSRIRVIHKENGGVSSARNTGLKASTGDYVTFIDSDDYVEPDYIQMLYQGMDNVDAVTCGRRIMQNGVELDREYPQDRIYLTNQQIKEAYQAKKNLYRFFRNPLKMYRRSVICDLRFDESLTMGEDIVFNLYFLQRAKAVRTIAYCGYNVRKRMDSITHQGLLEYSGLREHSNTHYFEAKAAAQKNWGFSDKFLIKERNGATPSRYFHQVMNLMLPGTPYNKSRIREKIKEIHEDKAFVQPILDQKYSDLSLKGKIARLSIQMDNPWITEVMFCCISKIYIIRTKSARLRKIH